MVLMQQQLNALNQDDDSRSKEAATTPRRSGGNKEIRKEKEGESSSTNIPALEAAKLTRKVEEVMQKAKIGPKKEDEYVMEATLPFVSKIMEVGIPAKFKLPQLPVFDGMGDPVIHIASFHNKMILQNINDAILCRAFPSTLTEIAQRWLHQLPQHSVSSFDDLTEQFRTRFITNIPPAKSIHDLWVCKQEANESLRSYLDRFNKIAMRI